MEPSAAHRLSRDWPEIVSVPITQLLRGDSPRLDGEDRQHVQRLVETETPLPAILVERRTMRVIDGMHRLLAASLRGDQTIGVRFFDGGEAEVFLRAVEENTAHGLPLSKADRIAAAERIIGYHPQMSDRAIARSAGLAAKTVAAIRRRSSADDPRLNARVGRDGRVRLLDSSQARQRAADILAQRPKASLREVAKEAGLSPATVLDVRNRLERGELPVPVRLVVARCGDALPGDRTGIGGLGRAPGGDQATAIASATPRNPYTSAWSSARLRRDQAPRPAVIVERLIRDPSLRTKETGMRLLRLLQAMATGMDQVPDMTAAVPPHRVAAVAEVARQYAQIWQEIAAELDRRAQVIDPARY